MDLDAGKLAVKRQLTRTKDGLSFTAPKRGKTRSVRLTGHAVVTLKDHRKRQLEESGSPLVPSGGRTTSFSLLRSGHPWT